MSNREFCALARDVYRVLRAGLAMAPTEPVIEYVSGNFAFLGDSVVAGEVLMTLNRRFEVDLVDGEDPAPPIAMLLAQVAGARPLVYGPPMIPAGHPEVLRVVSRTDSFGVRFCRWNPASRPEIGHFERTTNTTLVTILCGVAQ